MIDTNSTLFSSKIEDKKGGNLAGIMKKKINKNSEID